LENYLKRQGYDRIIGHHFFSKQNVTSIPVFALDQLGQSPYPAALVSRVGTADAPATAHPGLAGEGAIPWLHLADTANSSQGGINTVYRLETAGGKPPATCKNLSPSFQVKYAAQCKHNSRDMITNRTDSVQTGYMAR
jgi:hypothetical protein